MARQRNRIHLGSEGSANYGLWLTRVAVDLELHGQSSSCGKPLPDLSCRVRNPAVTKDRLPVTSSQKSRLANRLNRLSPLLALKTPKSLVSSQEDRCRALRGRFPSRVQMGLHLCGLTNPLRCAGNDCMKDRVKRFST